MANKSGWSFSIDANVEVQQDKLNKASRILDSFYSKYKYRSINIDTDDMIDATKRGISIIKDLYEDGTKDATSWLNIRPEMKSEMEKILSDAESVFSEIKVLFNDGSYLSGLDNILNGFDRQLSVVFADIGGYYDELRQKEKEFNDYLGKANSVSPTASQIALEERIKIINDLIETQKELQNVNANLTKKDFLSGFDVAGLQKIAIQLDNALSTMQEYDLSTFEEYRQRERILKNISDLSTWDGDDQFTYKHEKEYGRAIEILNDYISEREKLIKQLQENEYILFSVDGIGNYVVSLNEQIAQYKKYLEEMTALKGDNAVVSDGGTGNLSGVVSQLELIKDAIVEIKNAFKPLTDALSNEDSAFSAMVKANIQDLERLNEKVNETFVNIKRLSEKEFYVANGTEAQTGTAENNTLDTNSILSRVKELKEEMNQAFSEMRVTITETFDLSTIDLKQGNIENAISNIYQQFVKLQEDVRKLGFVIETSTVFKHITDTNADETAGAIQKETDKVEQAEGAFEKTAGAKKDFSDANKDAAKTADVTTPKVEAEGEAFEEAGKKAEKSAKAIRASQEKIASEYKNAFGGKGKINPNIANNFNASLADAGLEPSSITASFRTRNYIEGEGDDQKVVTGDTVKIIAKAVDKTGELRDVTREYAIESGKLIDKTSGFKEVKDAFDLTKAKNTAKSQLDELIQRMGSFKISTEAVSNALKNIKDEATFKVFESELDAANQKLKEIKATLKSTHSLDPITNADSSMANMVTTVDTFKKQIAKFKDIEGFGTLETHLNTINTKLTEFNNAKAQNNGKEMARIVAEINKEIAAYNAQLKLVTERQKAEELSNRLYNNAIKAQEKLYKAKKKLIGLDSESTKGKEATRKLVEAQEEYNNAISETNKSLMTQAQLTGIKAHKDTQEAEYKQAQKDYDTRFANKEKEKELNALYRERNTIISNIIKYNNKANNLKTEKGRQAAKEQLELAKQELAVINELIEEYGELVNRQKLKQQDDRMSSRQNSDNTNNAITQKQKRELEDFNTLLNRRKDIQSEIVQLQKQLGNANSDAEREAIQKELDQLVIREKAFKTLLMTRAQNDNALLKMVNDQDNNFAEQQGKNQRQQNIKTAADTAKTAAEEQKEIYKDVLSLVQQIYEAQAEVHKMTVDPSGKVHTAELEKENKRIEELGKLLKEVYGIDINNLMESLNKSSILTQEQKNKLLEEERGYRKDIVDLTAAAADEEATTLKREQERQNKKNQNYGKTIFNRESRYNLAINESLSSLENVPFSADFLSQVDKYKDAYKDLKELRDKFESDPNAANDSTLTNKFQKSALSVEKLRKELMSAFKEYEKFNNIPSDSIIARDVIDTNEFNSAKAAMVDFANSVTDGKFKLEGFNSTGTEMYGIIDKGNGVLQEVTVRFNSVTNEMVAFTSGAKNATTSWNKLGEAFKSKVKQMAGMYLSLHDIIRVFRNGVKYVKEIDLAMTELKKVTDETDEAYKRFLEDASAVSAVIGSTVSDFTDATAAFARLGYTIDEASSMAKTAIIYKNVADGLDTVEEATDSIISTMMAFGIEANNTMSIIDKFNAVGNNFAITSAGIGDALQRSASALYSAGNTIDESVALVTAANSVIQNPEQVGNALKTLSLRLRGAKVELEEAGLETDNMAESTAALQAKLLALTHGKVNIMIDDDTFKNTTQILREMSEAWKDMTDIERASALELMGGKRQANILSSVITNFETVEDVIKTSTNSTGSAMAENTKWLDSIEGKTYQFTNALETMWSNLLNPEVIKGFIDFGTGAIQFLDSVPGKVTAIIAALAGLAKFKGISLLSLGKDGVASLKNYQQALYKIQALQNIGMTGSAIDGGNTAYSTTAINAYAAAVDGLTAKKQAEMLATAGLNKVQIIEVLQRNNVSDAVIGETLSKMNLVNTTGQLTTITVKEALATQLSEDAMKEKAVADFIAANGSKTLNIELIQTMVSQELLSAEQGAAIIQAYGLAGANTALAGSFKTLGLAIKGMFMSNPIGFLLMVIPTLITIGGLIKGLIPTTEDYIQEWEDVKDKIESINQELETTKSRIDELESKGVLSFTDKKELELLKQQNDELERRLRLEEKAAKEAGNKAKEAIEKDYKKDFVKTAIRTDKDVKEYDKLYNVISAIDTYMTNSSYDMFGTLSKEQQELIKTLVPGLVGSTWDTLDFTTRQAVMDVYDKFKTEIQNFDHISGANYYVSGETYIDQAIQKIKEYKDEIYDANGQLKIGLEDEYVVNITTNIDELESDLAATAGELYTYLDNYGDDDSDPFVQKLKAQIDKIDMMINPVEFYNKKFDEIFGKYSTHKKALYELAEQGKLTANVLNGSSYAPLMAEMSKLGITADDVADHINALSEIELSKVTNPTFNISDYESVIDSVQEKISEYQSALKSLEEGTFTYSDFIDLTQKFPDLAKGVDKSSKSFNGLAKNLKKAIKASPDGLVKELKALSKQLAATGKSTDDIDQLIFAIENLPDEAVKNLSDEYVTLADKINDAKKAQNELQEAMNENPNEGYETRGEALEAMKTLMSEGKIGSESELWDITKEFFGDDPEAFAMIANRDADALAKLIATREKWYKTDDDDNYTFEGVENFVELVETVVDGNEDLQKLLTWNYDENTGVFDFKFDNANWDAIVKYLSETEELAGLTSAEFHDLLVQIGQYFGLNWENVKDVETHLKTIADSASDAKTKVEEYGAVMQTGFGKDTKIDLTNRPRIDIGDGNYETLDSRSYSNSDNTMSITVTPILPDGKKLSEEDLQKYAEDIANGADPATYEFIFEGKTYTGDDIVLGKHFGENHIDQANEFGQALHNAQEEYYALLDTYKANPLSINVDGNIETDIIKPLKEAGLKVEEVIDNVGQKQFTFDVIDLETLMRDKGYTTESIMAVINRLFGEGSDQSNLVEAREDIQNISSLSKETCDRLKELGITYSWIMNSQGATLTIDSNVDEVLKKYQFTDEEIDALKIKWESYGININTKADTSGAEDSKEALDKIPDSVGTTLTADDSEFQTTMAAAQKTLDDFCRARTATITVNTVTGEKVTGSNTPYSAASSAFNNRHLKQNAIYADGTAHAEGSWGAPRTETALTGELGPEILVRNGRWTTVGENGAEFTQVKKGDIIFNHKQSEQLLKNGYVTGRGKLHGGAFASGTAFADGGGTFSRYEFSGDGGYVEYDVNGNVVDTFGDFTAALADAADSVGEFEEAIDWIAIRMEEYDETIGKLSAELENLTTVAEKNAKIDEIIAENQKKYSDALVGAAYYEEYAQKYLAGMNDDLVRAAKNGAMAITDFTKEQDEATVNAINNYRDYAQKAADLYQQAEEILTDIRNSVIQKIDNIQSFGDAKTAIEDLQTEKLQNRVDLDEAMGEITSPAYYEAMMENSGKKIEYWKPLLENMQKEFDKAVEDGQIKVGSIEWYEQLAKLYEVQAEIDAATIELEEFQNSINDIYWDNFDQLINRIEYLKDETQSLIDLMGNEDMVITPETEGGWTADDVKWTDEGLASLGLYAQQMEIAEFEARQYAEAIDQLTADYEAGKYSENEYLEKLNELKSAQHDAIDAYNDSKEAIVDLNEARIDAIKEGIEKEIDAYSELIEKQKEALDAEKD